MDEGRKYRQHGYQDSDRDRDRRNGGSNGDSRSRPPQGPKTFQDPTGPRLPRLVQAVASSRCYSCATTLPPGTEYAGPCPKCAVALHVCKQCAHFEPSTRFQCLKPIKERIAAKDVVNTCELFSAKVTISRDAPQQAALPAAPPPSAVRTPNDARAAFDNLFKK